MRIDKVILRLLGIKGLRVTQAVHRPIGLIIDVRPRHRRPKCGVCGRTSPRYDQSPSRLWRHLALGKTVFWLRYAPHRVSCKRCSVRVEKVPWAAHDSRHTRDFEEMTAWLAQRMDRTATCRLMGINWRTVGTIVTRVIEERLDPARLEDLYVIGVDELSHRRYHHYVTVVVDHLKKRVVWVGDGKKEKTLNQFFDKLGHERARKLTHVTMDLSASFIKSVNKRAPQAEKVFDRFHVQKLASEAVDKVRRAEMRRVSNPREARALKRSRWALLKNPWNLTCRQGAKLRELQKTNQRLYRAYLLKESLARGLEYRQPKRASAHLDEWMRWASRSKLKPFVKLARTIKRFKQGILAYVATGLSNGGVEGLNNKVRLITRRAYGFHSTAALRAMIYLCCGGIVLHPALPIPE